MSAVQSQDHNSLWCVVSVCLEQMITAALLKIISTFMYVQLAMQESLSKLLYPVSLGSSKQRSCTRPPGCSQAGKVPQSCLLSGVCSGISSTACFRALCGKRQSELTPGSATAKTMCIHDGCFRAGTAPHTGKQRLGCHASNV